MSRDESHRIKSNRVQYNQTWVSMATTTVPLTGAEICLYTYFIFIHIPTINRLYKDSCQIMMRCVEHSFIKWFTWDFARCPSMFRSTTLISNNGAAIDRSEFALNYLCFRTTKRIKFLGITRFVHSWRDSPIIFNRDCVIHENCWRITPLRTKNIIIHGNAYIILYVL